MGSRLMALTHQVKISLAGNVLNSTYNKYEVAVLFTNEDTPTFNKLKRTCYQYCSKPHSRATRAIMAIVYFLLKCHCAIVYELL